MLASDTLSQLYAAATAETGLLSQEQVRATLAEGLAGRFDDQRVLVLIPDHTRTMPLPLLFRLLVDVLQSTRQLDFMVALGTHLPLNDESLLHLVGLSAEERETTYRHIGLFNHVWDDDDALQQVGTLSREQVQNLAGEIWHPSLGGDVPVRISRRALDYDHLLIVGPTFPHEVVGFSGGAKYLFPGISGPEMINVTHWMGALQTILHTIGIERTPMRAMIHAAARLVPVPMTLVALVVEDDGVAGLFVGPHEAAFHAAARLSSERHIVWLDRPFERVLSHAPPMYDELWTAAKAMYKLEPGVADGGELTVYAPHLRSVSVVHGKHIFRIGYHVRDYFLKQWEQFADVPLGVLAHSTHLKGSGVFEDGVERPRIRVTLASQISREDCETLNLGYADPATIDPAEWQGREDEGVVYIPKAGEHLYRVRSEGR
jgi:nickel-dependent lactate racemase